MRALIKKNDIEQKSGTLEQAGMRYGFGRNAMRKVAEDAGAIFQFWIGIWILYLDKYYKPEYVQMVAKGRRILVI